MRKNDYSRVADKIKKKSVNKGMSYINVSEE